MEKSTLADKMVALWEKDDNGEICEVCGEAPNDCSGHSEEERLQAELRAMGE